MQYIKINFTLYNFVIFLLQILWLVAWQPKRSSTLVQVVIGPMEDTPKDVQLWILSTVWSVPSIITERIVIPYASHVTTNLVITLVDKTELKYVYQDGKRIWIIQKGITALKVRVFIFNENDYSDINSYLNEHIRKYIIPSQYLWNEKILPTISYHLYEHVLASRQKLGGKIYTNSDIVHAILTRTDITFGHSWVWSCSFLS